MDEPGITPSQHVAADIYWLEQQHLRDLAALERAADTIVAKDARIAQLEADQASLILHSRRQER